MSVLPSFQKSGLLRWLIPLVIATVLSLAAYQWYKFLRPALPPNLQATYVGRQSCAACHQGQMAAFDHSQHDDAMQVANSQTVLARFDDQWIEESGQSARFYKVGERFMVETQGEDGQLANFKIEWTFGLKPLQQYMVRMPSSTGESASEKSIGRVQVLRWCWDVDAQKWYHTDPFDVHEALSHDDELHWTGPAQRWNNMCAECHSTDVRKSYDVAEAKYHTTFNEMDVSCEACHGPASIHLELAKNSWYQPDSRYGHGLANLEISAEKQIQSCAPCHSRRSGIADGYKPGDIYSDFYSESLLDENIYFNDGQVLDEDYVHGSFIQSKMYHKGIKCSDCHDPHTAKLIRSGNEVCTSCHQHPSYKYDTPAHHFHTPGTAGAACVECHMPATTYMGIDSRRDHSFRIPRPDLSVSLGTPNACTGCHLKNDSVPVEDRGNLTQYLDWMMQVKAGNQVVAKEVARVDKWCNDACDKWYGDERKQPYHFAVALDAARKEKPDAAEKLIELLQKNGPEAPAIARATALQDFLMVNPVEAAKAAGPLLSDPSPMVRAAAVVAKRGESQPEKLFQSLKPLLADPVRLVRIEAARVLIDLFPAINAFREPAGQQALNELRDSLRISNDRAGAHLALGSIEQQLGNTAAAIAAYENAIRIEPSVAGPRKNLAAVLSSIAAGENSSAEIRQSLQDRISLLRREELPLLQRDARFASENAQIAYQLGLSYYLNDDLEEAKKELRRASELEPRSIDYAIGYIVMLQKLEKFEAALDRLNQILEVYPDNPMLLQMRRETQAQTK